MFLLKSFLIIFSVITVSSSSCFAENLFDSHDQMMKDAIMEDNLPKVKALLKTPYILDENHDSYSQLAIDRNKMKSIYFFLSEFDIKLPLLPKHHQSIIRNAYTMTMNGALDLGAAEDLTQLAVLNGESTYQVWLYALTYACSTDQSPFRKFQEKKAGGAIVEAAMKTAIILCSEFPEKCIYPLKLQKATRCVSKPACGPHYKKSLTKYSYNGDASSKKIDGLIQDLKNYITDPKNIDIAVNKSTYNKCHQTIKYIEEAKSTFQLK